MRKEQMEDSPLVSKNYTFVSVETLRNCFPGKTTSERLGRIQAPDDVELTREGFNTILGLVSSPISEPESKSKSGK